MVFVFYTDHLCVFFCPESWKQRYDAVQELVPRLNPILCKRNELKYNSQIYIFPAETLMMILNLK